ncbi:MAG: DUF3899 domain-containing protein [Symbiobacteriaceae bacterium]|nr:DUF3899 domain-containing protein [Symbiobacteriaceae bacterium]
MGTGREYLSRKIALILAGSLALSFLLSRRSPGASANFFVLDSLFITAMTFIIVAAGQIVRSIGFFNSFVMALRALGRSFLPPQSQHPPSEIAKVSENYPVGDQGQFSDTFLLLAIGAGLLAMAYAVLVMADL